MRGLRWRRPAALVLVLGAGGSALLGAPQSMGATGMPRGPTDLVRGPWGLLEGPGSAVSGPADSAGAGSFRAEGPPAEREEVRRARAVSRESSARLQLARAQRAKKALLGTRGRERMDRRWEAACAYIAVRVHFPGKPCSGAEGAFRAGELLRGGGDLDVALREFRVVRGLCAGGPYHARAMLEIAHLERRLGRAREALDAYAELYAGQQVPPALRAESMLWAGRVHHAQGQADEASRLWLRVARGAEDPVHRVRAFDLLALALIDRRDLEGAAGMLERCRRALLDIAQEETQTGERVRAALQHMRAVGRLRRSVAQRRGTVRLDGEHSK